MNRTSITDQAGFLLRKIHARMETSFNQLIAKHGITTRQYMLLRVLYENKDASIYEVAQICDVDPGAVTRIIVRLEEKDLVVKEVAAHDARQLQLNLTPKGQKLIPELLTASHNFPNHVKKDLDQDELRRLVLSLERFIHS